MSVVEDTMCMHYVRDRLNSIVTESDMLRFIDEIDHDLKVNEEWRQANPNISDEHDAIDPDDFDVQGAIDNMKRNYIERAMTRSKNVTEAAKLLGLKNYQTLQNWMDKLGVDYD
jgi:transcriptional regulator with PAS, ATPase and Fis domain